MKKGESNPGSEVRRDHATDARGHATSPLGRGGCSDHAALACSAPGSAEELANTENAVPLPGAVPSAPPAPSEAARGRTLAESSREPKNEGGESARGEGTFCSIVPNELHNEASAIVRSVQSQGEEASGRRAPQCVACAATAVVEQNPCNDNVCDGCDCRG